MADTLLERIVAVTRSALAERQMRIPLDEVQMLAAAAPTPRPFTEVLRPVPGSPARLIAEIKCASPSRGLFPRAFDQVAQARAYVAGGTSAISILTERRFFHGSLDDLRAVRMAVELPVLHRDFILGGYQIYEARAAGADAVFLIGALLDEGQLAEYVALAGNLGMEVLVEVHNAEEVRHALASGAQGVMSGGSLGTPEVLLDMGNTSLSAQGVMSGGSLGTFALGAEAGCRLRPLVPTDRLFVAESSICDVLGAVRARSWGADAILVSEALMSVPDPVVKVHDLAHAPGGATAALFSQAAQPFVKICGLTDLPHAIAVSHLHADAFGLMFAPSRRRVTLEHAIEITRAVRQSSKGAGPLAVGVFINEDAASITDIADCVGLQAIQLSGDESPEFCMEVAARTTLPVIKAVRMRKADDMAILDAYASAGATLLFDTPAAGSYGGTGQVGDWMLAREAAARWPIILAGGLSPANVGSALAVVAPRGVDVSSGVEINGAKDAQKIQMFIAAARSYVRMSEGGA